MQTFWERAEEFWNHNRTLAWALVVSGLAVAFWATLYPQSPGVAIGLLALVAGIMSVRSNMHSAEKFGWVGLLITFAILEVLAINRTDAENKGIRETQNKKFGDIAGGLENSYQQSQKQFSATKEAMGKVFDKTKEASDTATDAVNTISGGDSFCYVAIAYDPNPNVKEVLPVIKVVGKHPLWNVTMRVVDYRAFTKDAPALMSSGKLTPNTALTLDSTIVTIGSIPVKGTTLFIPTGIDLDLGNGKNYEIEFYALNGNWREDLRSRKINGKWADAIRVFRVRGSEAKPIKVFESIDKSLLRNPDGKFDWDN